MDGVLEQRRGEITGIAPTRVGLQLLGPEQVEECAEVIGDIVDLGGLPELVS